MATVAVIGGAGYVGLSYAVALAEMGHDVTAVDQDTGRIGLLRHGQTPIHEPGLPELLQRGLASGNLTFTGDAAAAIPRADFAFICVGTPSTASGAADTTAVAAAARILGRYGRDHTVIVNKSTMPVGSAQFVADILAEHAQPGATFAVVSNPEFLREGSAIEDIFHPDRIVLGADDRAAAEAVATLYASLHAPTLVTTPRSAEMIKYASNAFLATKISFINEVATICEQLGADVDAVARGMGLDGRISPFFLRAGLGFGGSCFPKDVRALAAMAAEHGCMPTMLNAVLDINAQMRARILAKLVARLGDLGGKRVGLLGLSFKPETDDTRESPAIALIEALLAAGATVSATDPVAIPSVAPRFPDVRFAPDAYGAAMGADALILATEWRCYRALDFNRLANAMRGHVVIDGRNAFDPARVHAAGFVYEGVGRVPTPAGTSQVTVLAEPPVHNVVRPTPVAGR